MSFAVIQAIIITYLLCNMAHKRKEQHMTAYMESLKEYEIDEMIEEEKVFREIFYTSYMDLKTLENAKRISNKKNQDMSPVI